MDVWPIAERVRDGKVERLVMKAASNFTLVDPKLAKDWPEVFGRKESQQTSDDCC